MNMPICTGRSPQQRLDSPGCSTPRHKTIARPQVCHFIPPVSASHWHYGRVAKAIVTLQTMRVRSRQRTVMTEKRSYNSRIFIDSNEFIMMSHERLSESLGTYLHIVCSLPEVYFINAEIVFISAECNQKYTERRTILLLLSITFHKQSKLNDINKIAFDFTFWEYKIA